MKPPPGIRRWLIQKSSRTKNGDYPAKHPRSSTSGRYPYENNSGIKPTSDLCDFESLREKFLIVTIGVRVESKSLPQSRKGYGINGPHFLRRTGAARKSSRKQL